MSSSIGSESGIEPGHRTAAMAVPAIEIRGLKKSFKGHLGIGRTTAVEQLELEVQQGEIFGFLGPNGAGKTTTFKLILGLLRADAGQIRIFGERIQQPAVRARIGYLPENPYFYDYLTATEFLDLYGRLQGIPNEQRHKRIEQTLERVGLAGRGKTALRKFSKGMVQRLGLAQAIQHDPDLVILDEPMSGLDPIGRREVRDLILSLRSAGRTVLFSSHILQDAEMICDRVSILSKGRLRSVGRLDELISTGAEWFEVGVRGTLREPNCATLLTRDGEQSLWRVSGLEALGEMMLLVKQSGADVTSVWPKRQTLEDMFMHNLEGEETP